MLEIDQSSILQKTITKATRGHDLRFCSIYSIHIGPNTGCFCFEHVPKGAKSTGS